ncbi:NHLP family bacteriocin export ABC transporter peptidase/permease/ATPase subunit [Oscillatoria sp. CS-180]|uniref:NHLP family bacteriocin export ABC transporter peptidase/permease/ATPase subunit n=1 Tax=Oscillatoria sp. CS-180 TaxID=3021720 RepID=UPI00232FD8B7|nr:NHLP family bacteriocin export ABC transporter peptidase/permease/ATPase subunit [Oscillatoria sp. CS-180]MDB9524592.1 NHLP family bacteriocin export ABC transporter peptidase/permease/ATPase subunit [Oscillatoria sp. CS-180]
MAIGFISNLVSRLRLDPSRTPTLIQMENVECGAAALGIILGYYGRIVPLPELRRECGVSRDGSKASNVLKAARLYGMQAKGFRRSIEELKQVRLPCIVFWNFNHFLVVEKFVGDQIYLNDPASGRRKTSQAEFNASYTGVVLVLQPGPDFEQGGRKKGILPALRLRLSNSKRALIFCLLAGLLLTLPRLTVPAFTQVFVDEVLVQNREDWLRPLLLGMIVTALIQGLLSRLRQTYLRRLMIKLTLTLSGQFIWHTLRLPVGFYAQRYAGEISNRTQLNDKVAGVISGQLATTLIDTLMIVFYAAIMFAYDWLLTLIAICFAAVNLVVLKLLADSRTDVNSKLAQESGKSVGVAISGLLSIESVKASGLESDLFSKFSGYYAKLNNAQLQAGLPNQMLATLPEFLSSIAVAVILLVGGLRVMNGTLSIGMLVAYQTLTMSFLAPVTTLLSFGSTLQDLEADLNRLDDVLENALDPEVERQATLPLDTPTHSEQPLGLPREIFRLQGHVELQDLTFGYSRLEPPLIDHLNLVLKPGQRVALVGGSGSGKSTVAKLVTGLYAPWSGAIRFDSVSRDEIPRSVLANSLAMVEQDIFLFAGTVRDNLTLWDPTIPLEDLIQACKDAEIHDLIALMPGGYDAKLSEGGTSVSGGQRQRLEIARSLVRNPAVLVLDEATSALDAETELLIDHNLRRRGCSCIVVAHRLSTIRDCDEIIVLDRGQVVQRGTHEELRLQEGVYQELVGMAAATDEPYALGGSIS